MKGKSKSRGGRVVNGPVPLVYCSKGKVNSPVGKRREYTGGEGEEKMEVENFHQVEKLCHPFHKKV